LAEVLAEGKEKTEASSKRIEQTKKLEADAASEAANGFPLLSSHSVVALWSALEDAIPRMCSDWLLKYPRTLERDDFSRVKLPPHILLLEDRTVAMEEIVLELARTTQSSLKAGVGRFDALIGALGIKLSVSKALRRDLFELSKVRNVIVHQLGKADRKFVQECPWLNPKVGDRLRIDPARYGKYRKVVIEYCVQIVKCGYASGEDRLLDQGLA